MGLKRLTDKNFLPSAGVKVIPVYHEHYNNMYDAVNRLNARDHHSMSQTRIIKHPLLAIGVWDYSVDGGATGTVNLNGAINMLPDNAIVRNVMYDIATTVVATGATAGLILKVPTDGNLATIDPIATGGTSGVGLGTPLFGTANTWVKTTAARYLQAEVTGAGVLNAGKVYFFIDYVVSELEESDYSVDA